MGEGPRAFWQCEQEALHLSGAIQPHGTLLGADADGVITHAADNAGALLGSPGQQWLGRALPPDLAGLAEHVGPAHGSARRGSLRDTGAGRLQALITRGPGGELVIELTERPASARAVVAPALSLSPGISRTAAQMAREESEVVERIADLTGFARTMYYRFREDGDGEVVAEARRGDAYGSYLGLRYPASDIPEIARGLYRKNPWRVIPSAPAAPVPVRSTTGVPLDLTYSELRSVSPVHQAYLANMGVVASLSFPIVMRDALVGLIAAHHPQPRGVALEVLNACASLLAEHVAGAVQFEMAERMRLTDTIAARIRSLRPRFESLARVEAEWDQVGRALVDGAGADAVHFDCQLGRAGLALSFGDHATPPDWDVLDAWLGQHGQGGVACCDNLVDAGVANAGPDIAGVMGLAVTTRGRRIRLFFTRREHVHEVAWGGRPDKPLELDGGAHVAPRRSFDRWVEKRVGYCRPWLARDRQFGLGIRAMLAQALG